MNEKELRLNQLELELEHALLKDVHRAYLDTAAGAPQRMIARAERAAGLSAGLSTSYLALVALQPALLESNVRWTGFVPALWFSVSIACYSIFITASGDREYSARPLSIAATELHRTKRLRSFVGWINRTALRSRWALQAGTASLAAGVFAMAIPLIVPQMPLLHLLGFAPWIIVAVSFVKGTRTHGE